MFGVAPVLKRAGLLAENTLGTSKLPPLPIETLFKWISREIREIVRIDLQRRTASLLAYIGFAYWIDFTNQSRENYLDQAIDLTERAHDVYAHDLDEGERGNQLLIGDLRNNLALYLAKRHEYFPSIERPSDRNRARGYAEYIHAISQNFPHEREEWEDTFREVMRIYP